MRPQPRVLTHSCISFARVLVYVSGPCQPDGSFYLPVALRVIGQIQRKSEAKARNSNSEVEIIPVLTEIIIEVIIICSLVFRIHSSKAGIPPKLSFLRRCIGSKNIWPILETICCPRRRTSGHLINEQNYSSTKPSDQESGHRFDKYYEGPYLYSRQIN